MENHATTIPPSSLTAAMNSLDYVRNLLEPYLGELTVEDCKALPYLSVDSLKRALDFMLANPENIPPLVNQDAMKKTAKEMDALWQLEQQLEQLAQCLSETILVAYNKNYPWLMELEKNAIRKMSA